MKYWIILFIAMFSTASFFQDKSIVESDLIGCWNHSREEDKSDSEENIYRPCDYKLPFSRYRHKFELNENRKCFWFSLSPNDAHSMIEATWTFQIDNQIIKIFNEENELIQKFKVIKLSDNIMEILILEENN